MSSWKKGTAESTILGQKVTVEVAYRYSSQKARGPLGMYGYTDEYTVSLTTGGGVVACGRTSSTGELKDKVCW